MFEIENAIPFRNAKVIQGHFTVTHPKFQLGDSFLAKRDGEKVGLVRILAIVSVNYTRGASNPMYHISVGYDGDYRDLVGTTLEEIQPLTKGLFDINTEA